MFPFLPSNPWAVGRPALRATALGTSRSSRACRPDTSLPTPPPGAAIAPVPSQGRLLLPRAAPCPVPPEHPAQTLLSFRGHGQAFSPIGPHQPGQEGKHMCPHRPSQDPSPLEARAILAPLGPLPVSPPPSPSPVAKASEIQPCAGNAVPSLPWAPRPIPSPPRPLLALSPPATASALGSEPQTPLLPAELIKLLSNNSSASWL